MILNNIYYLRKIFVLEDAKNKNIYSLISLSSASTRKGL